MSITTFDPQSVSVTITPAAKAYIEQWLARSPETPVFKLSTTKTGCSGFAYHSELVAEAGNDDVTVNTSANFPIVMAAESIALLADMTIDFQEQGLGQKKLVYLNPNETARCGCGESFTTKNQV